MKKKTKYADIKIEFKPHKLVRGNIWTFNENGLKKVIIK